MHLVLGYPISKNKVSKTVNPESNEVKTGFQTIVVKIDRKIKMSIFVGKNDGVHLGFRYNLDHLKQKLPFSRGMSGGGVWYIPNIYNLNRFYLNGIFIEYHKKEKVGIATKARYLKRLAEKNV